MSQENVEIARRWIDLFKRRDTEGLARLTEPAFWLRDGKVYREETFTDRAEALEAVGLSE